MVKTLVFYLEVKKIILSNSTKPFKLIILDCDNTLWGGTLGDLGWKKINIGGHNMEGEAFKDFQLKLKGFKNNIFTSQEIYIISIKYLIIFLFYL